MTEAIDLQTRVKAIAAAQGKEPFDLLLTGGRVVDVATLELREADIGVVGAMIASVHPRGTFEHNKGDTASQQLVGRGEPRDAAADNRHVDALVIRCHTAIPITTLNAETAEPAEILVSASSALIVVVTVWRGRGLPIAQ